MKRAILFPGQGSQSIGMLSDIASRASSLVERFSVASEIVGQDLWKVVQEGPKEELNKTENTQPILLAASIALWELFREEACDDKCEPAFAAGHSLGEYSALVAAGVIDYETAVSLVRSRGLLMESACPLGKGGMAAIIGLELETVESCCADIEGVVGPANINAPDQIVISGDRLAVEEAISRLKAVGAKRALPLEVSGPFHSPLMEAAASEFRKILDGVTFSKPTIPVVHNVDIQFEEDPERIKRKLVDQLFRPVQWSGSMALLAKQGVTEFVECGPGNVLKGLAKKNTPQIPTLAVLDVLNGNG